MNTAFEHKFIPKIVDNSNKNDFELDSVEIFDSFEFVGGCFSEYFPKEEKTFDWDAFSIKKEMNSLYEYWLLRFPQPDAEGDARWGVIMHKEGKPFRYYLLENAEDGCVLSTYDKEVRKELAKCAGETTCDEFIAMVMEQK